MHSLDPRWRDPPEQQDFYGAALAEAVRVGILFPEAAAAKLAAAREALQDAMDAVYFHAGKPNP